MTLVSRFFAGRRKSRAAESNRIQPVLRSAAPPAPPVSGGGKPRSRVIESVFDPAADQEEFRARTRNPGPSGSYCILFTPRSGSSWLTSILTQSRAMGTPNEWFNPELMPSSAGSFGARNLDQFIEAVTRHRIHGGLFGFELTHHQLMIVFGSTEEFMSRFGGSTFFWLIREDIVAQAVSLHKMVETSVSHSAYCDPQEISRSDSVYAYNPNAILHWIGHIRAAEAGTEAMIAEFGLTPVMLSYEGMTARGAGPVLDLFAQHLHPDLPTGETELVSEHQKIGTRKNDEFAARFRAEHPEFLHQIDADRAPMLARLRG